MAFLNVKVREHKEAQLDLISCIVHLTVDDKNVCRNHGWGQTQSKAAKPLHDTDKDAGAANIM